MRGPDSNARTPDITHEFFYKAKDEGVAHPEYESLLADISERLCIEDKTFIKFRVPTIS